MIKHYGFSFHGTPELLDKLLTQHPDVDFVQLQINYADWENPKVQSRACYEVARKHNKEIVVMEPVKGGALASPDPKVKEIFDSIDPNVSYASWAIRFVASLDGIRVVLSGMSNTEQMNDNLSFMKEFAPLNEKEQEAIQKAQKIYHEQKTIGCTACHYCTGGCPKHIAIPEVFAARNEQISTGHLQKGKEMYKEVLKTNTPPTQCIGCGQCESVCPQKLEIIRLLKDCTAHLQ